ncbi:MAG: DUF4258 domain-containing protein [Bdellovibrionota bacterium]
MSSVIEDLKSGNFTPTLHAQERMSEREISFDDIVHAGKTCKNSVKNLDNTWEIDGFDCDGKRLIVICVRYQKTLIITLFRKSRRRK